MKTILLFSTLIFSAAHSFAQDEERNAEISELARKNAQAYCECPSMDLLISFTKDFEQKKITLEEYKESGKIAIAQIAECTQPFVKEIRTLTKEEYEFFLKESQKYRLEFCQVTIDNHKESDPHK